MPSDFRHNGDLPFDPISPSQSNDEFRNLSSLDTYSSAQDIDTFSADESASVEEPFGLLSGGVTNYSDTTPQGEDDFISDGTEGFSTTDRGSSNSGSNGGNRPHQNLLPALLTIIVVAVLLSLILLSQLFKPDPISVSLSIDTGDIITTVTEQANGTYCVSLRHEISNLNPSQFYIAGFMMAPEGESLIAVGEPIYISMVSSYTVTTEFLITRPGKYSLAFYSYPLLNPLPSVTKTHTLILGDGSRSLPSTDESLVVALTPTPTSCPTPTPTPTATLQPSTAVSPSSHKLRPDSDVFDIYDVNTRYYYQQLTDAQKIAFSEIYDGIVNTQVKIPLTPCSQNDFELAINTIFFDCPELFIFDYERNSYHFYSFEDQIFSVLFDDFYRLSTSTYRAQLKQSLEIIDSFTGLPGFGDSDYSKELAISTYIVDHTKYNKDVPYCAYADSVYLYGYAKCTGYTNAFNLALRYYGIPCAAVIGNTYDNGTISPDGHMWSLVQIDDQWYHCDATWNDQDGIDLYPYFNLNDRLIFSARSMEISTQTKMVFSLPQCISLSQNFAMQEGIFIPSGSNVTEMIATTIANMYNAGRSKTIFMFESASDLSTALIQLQNKSISTRAANILKARFKYSWGSCADVNTLMIYDLH